MHMDRHPEMFWDDFYTNPTLEKRPDRQNHRNQQHDFDWGGGKAKTLDYISVLSPEHVITSRYSSSLWL